MPLSTVYLVVDVNTFFVSGSLVPITCGGVCALESSVKGAGNRVGVPANAFCGKVSKCVLEISRHSSRASVVGKIVMCGRAGGGNGADLAVTSSTIVGVSGSGDCLAFVLCRKAGCRRAGAGGCESAALRLDGASFEDRRLIVPLRGCTFRGSSSDHFGSRIGSVGLGRLRCDRSSVNVLRTSDGVRGVESLGDAETVECNDRLSATGGTDRPAIGFATKGGKE